MPESQEADMPESQQSIHPAPPSAGPSRSASAVAASSPEKILSPADKDDPLAEFYEQARYEAEDTVRRRPRVLRG